MSNRKRHFASDPEEDELSPTKSSRQKDIFGTAKKRKLNNIDSPLSSEAPIAKPGLIRSLSGLFGYGKGNGTEKENAPVDEGEVDELGEETHSKERKKDVWDVPDEDEPPVLHPSSARKGRGKAKTPSKTTKPTKVPETPIVNDSVEEDIAEKFPKPISSRKNKGTSTPNSTTKLVEKKTTAGPKRGKTKQNGVMPEVEFGAEDTEVEELEDLGRSRYEENLGSNSVIKSARRVEEVTPKRGRPKLKPGSKPTSNTGLRKSGSEADDTPRRGRGRPRKDQSTKIASKAVSKSSKSKEGVEVRGRINSNNGSEVEDYQEDRTTIVTSGSKRGLRKSEIHKKAKQLSREAAREAMSKAIQQEERNRDKYDEGDQKARRAIGRSESNFEDEDELAPPDLHQKSKSAHVFVTGSPQHPKGILTPGGRKRGPKPRKSVIFQDTEELDLGFKDLPLSSSKKRVDAAKVSAGVDGDIAEIEGDADSDQSEEISCAVCSGLDETKFNKIILCDGCDFAVHQVCYDLAKVPRGDWFCKDCQFRQDSLFIDPDTVTQDNSSEVPDTEGFDHHLRVMQTVLLSRLTGNARIRLLGHDNEMEKVHQVVKQTVLAGEGNSMLVIGARGSGKTTLVENVIDDLSEFRESFHVVRLNGFIHTDDKLALKDIWRQLGREMEIADDSKATANDTLQSLLALLSHPSELAESEEGHTTKSVVFLLDEFDLFTTHPRQTLLYNLFDIAQARKAPIVVLGLTTRVDVAEALEKRVKSRFSHRYVHLSLSRSVNSFGEICRSGLTANIEELEAAGFNIEAEGMEDFVTYWHTMIEDLYQDIAFKNHLETYFYRTKSVPEFLTSCILPLANLSTKNFPLKARAFISNNMSLSAPDSKLHILQGLSELELAMLISAARLDIILDTDTCNFAMVYDEYCSLTSRHKIQTSSSGITALGAGAKVWGRDVALGAWERLADYDILVPAGVGGAAARDLGVGGRMWKADVALEEIAGSVTGLSSIMMKWCREI